jgi:hypothetical protein
VLPASPITWFFSGPVDLPTVQSSLMVLANGNPQFGIFQLSPDGTILTYYPTAPLPAGSTVRFYQRTPIFSDVCGVNFQIAPSSVELLLLGFTIANSLPRTRCSNSSLRRPSRSGRDW